MQQFTTANVKQPYFCNGTRKCSYICILYEFTETLTSIQLEENGAVLIVLATIIAEVNLKENSNILYR